MTRILSSFLVDTSMTYDRLIDGDEPRGTPSQKEIEMAMAKTVTLSEDARALFLWYVADAGNWGGTPWIDGNRDFTKEDRGWLTELKRKKLVTTHADEDGVSLHFTPAGVAYASAAGVSVDGITRNDPESDEAVRS
jgi:hypothetical protein